MTFFCLVEAHFSRELWWKFEHPWDARARGRCHLLYCWQVLEKGSFPHGGTLDFKWREWSIEFSGFEIFRLWGFVLGRKIWQVCFWRTQTNVKSRGRARVSRPRSSANKVQPNLFCGCFIVAPAFCPEWEIPRSHFSTSLVY